MLNKRFGRLVVVEYAGSKKHNRVWRCLCDCGGVAEVPTTRLNLGKTRSCGCLASELTAAKNFKHGHTAGRVFTPEYHSWVAMLTRCNNKVTKGYKTHGSHGVTVCKSWESSFVRFLEDMGKRPEGTSLDRIDNCRGYYKENCRWATHIEQARNRRNTLMVTVNGVSKPLMEWCEIHGLKRSAVRSRVEKAGHTYESAILSLVAKAQCKHAKQ